MHGRLKIKTTAQQEAEKKKERAAKLGNMSDTELTNFHSEMSFQPATGRRWGQYCPGGRRGPGTRSSSSSAPGC